MISARFNCSTYDFGVILSVCPAVLLAVAVTTQSTYGMLSMVTSARPFDPTITWMSWQQPIRCASLRMARSSTADLIRRSGCSTRSGLAGIVSRGLLSVRDHSTPRVSSLQRGFTLFCVESAWEWPAVLEMEWNDYLFVIILCRNQIRILVYGS